MSLDSRFIEQARRDLTALLAAHPELEEDDVLRLDMIEGQTNALELLDKLIAAELDAQAMESALETWFERISKRRERYANRRIAVRKYMLQIMEAAGFKKVERPAATVSIAAGRPKAVITDESALPDRFIRVTREPNKNLIWAVLKDGNPVPGATLSNAEPQLRIS